MGARKDVCNMHQKHDEQECLRLRRSPVEALERLEAFLKRGQVERDVLRCRLRLFDEHIQIKDCSLVELQ